MRAYAPVLAALMTVPIAADERAAPMLLQIYRDSLQPGGEARFDEVEQEAARICARLGFPNPHLAIESLTGPKEVWWLNAFDSEPARQRVVESYTKNPELVTALEGISKRREGLIGTPIDVLTAQRVDLSDGASWQPAGARFFVVTMTRGAPPQGAVFEAPDGTRYVLSPVRTRREAEADASALAPGTRVFAVRPQWGMAAREWIAADPEFWKPNPMAGPK